jgi:hypothetical protein
MDASRTKPVSLWKRVQYPLTLLLVALSGVGVVAVSWGPQDPGDPHLLVKPMLALAALTFAVLLSAAALRHWAVLTRRMSMNYARDLKTDPPAEWIERPARTYNNLMQAPTLFYVVCLLMIATPWADAAQIRLAWAFVGLRAAHALIYLAWNNVPLRFAAFTVSAVALMAMWARFAFCAPHG